MLSETSGYFSTRITPPPSPPMSTVASSMGPSNTADERQPLLESRTKSVYVGVQSDPEAAVSADEALEAKIIAKKVDYWRLIWYLVFATFGGVILAGVIKGFVKNVDVEVRIVASGYLLFGRLHALQFDFKKAFNQALGSGLSGAAGMNTLCVG